MSAAVRKTAIEVGNVLRDLGTRRDWLIQVAETMAVAASECTENDPFGSEGWRRYQMGTRRLRELHLPSGEWERSDTEQIASILHPGLNVRIIVMNADAGTCIERLVPRNRAKKGVATDRIVEANRQPTFWDAQVIEDVVSFPPKAHDASAEDDATAWHLCVFHDDDELRAELTCFTKSVNGFLEQPTIRVFLLGGEAPPVDLIEDDAPDSGDDSDFDIPVIRKS